MEIFKLFGSIFIDNAEANKSIQKTGEEANNSSNMLDKFGDIAKNTAIAIGKISLAAAGAAFTFGGLFLRDSMQAAKEFELAQAKLAQVMGNTMNATDEEIQSIIELTDIQSKLGVQSQNTQLAGAQELSTYLEKSSTLEKLIPVMNDMLAQQYGVNASQENAVSIGTMLGKVMDGQVRALKIYGYTFDEAQEKILKFGTESERAAVLTNVISNSIGGMNQALLETDAGKMFQLSQVLDAVKLKIGKVANEFKLKVIGEMLPSISKLAEAFLNILEGTGTSEELSSAFKEVFDNIVNVLKDMLPIFIDIGTKIIITIITGIIAAIPDLIKNIKDIVAIILENILDGLEDILPILTPLIEILKVVIDNLDTILGVIIPLTAAFVTYQLTAKAVSVAQGLVNTKLSLFENIVAIATGKLSLLTIAKNLATKAQWALNAAWMANPIGLILGLIAALISGIIYLWNTNEGFKNGVIAAWHAIEEAGKQIFGGLIKLFTEDIPNACKFVIDFFKNNWKEILLFIVNPIAGSIALLYKLNPKFKEWIDNFIKNAKDGFAKLMKNILQFFKDIPKKISNYVIETKDKLIEWVSDLPEKFKELGKNMIDGLIQGMKNMYQSAIDGVKKLGEMLVDGFKSVLGIKSPSKVFAEIGKFSGEGFINGLKSMSNKVDKAIDDVFGGLDRNIDYNVGFNSSNTNPINSKINRTIFGETQKGIVNNYYTIGEFKVTVSADSIKSMQDIFNLFDNFHQSSISYEGVS